MTGPTGWTFLSNLSWSRMICCMSDRRTGRFIIRLVRNRPNARVDSCPNVSLRGSCSWSRMRFSLSVILPNK